MTTPTFDTIRIDREADAPAAHLVLDRPERLNALSGELLRDLMAACRWLDDQPDVKVVVVRGEGRAFSAGFDLDDFVAMDGLTREVAELGRLATEALDGIRALTIAAVHGHCVGGGVVLAAACDLRLASDDVRFSIPEVDLGIPLAWSGIPRLARELGPAITKELVLTCRPFDAHEAHSLRFVNRVVPAGDLFDAATQLADELATKPTFSLRATKTHVDAVMAEIAGTARNANDADTLVAALRDPESRAFGKAYLERFTARD